MTERDVENILQRARERFPDESPRVISDNGPPFVARGFKIFIALAGMTHVRASPYYPQSNGKIERWHQSLKSEKLRLDPADSPEEARTQVERYGDYYNTDRLHGAIEYVTPLDKLQGGAPRRFSIDAIKSSRPPVNNGDCSGDKPSSRREWPRERGRTTKNRCGREDRAPPTGDPSARPRQHRPSVRLSVARRDPAPHQPRVGTGPMR